MICGVSRGASAMRFPDVEIIMHADSAARLTTSVRNVFTTSLPPLWKDQSDLAGVSMMD